MNRKSSSNSLEINSNLRRNSEEMLKPFNLVCFNAFDVLLDNTRK